MIKLDIINEVVNRTGITKTKAEMAVETVFDPPAVYAWVARAAPGSWRTATSDPMPWEGRFLPAAQLTASFGEHTTVAKILDGEAGAQVALLQLAALWERADVLVTPAMATVPPRIGEPSPYGPGWAADYTLPFNLTRSPAAVVPWDLDSKGVPTSIQIVGRPFDEATLLSLGAQIEQARPWAQRRPPVS